LRIVLLMCTGSTADAPRTRAAPNDMTPVAAPVPLDTTYPNRPSNMRLIGHFDGTVKEADGHAFGIADFGNWFDHNVPTDIQVVGDRTNPTGSGKALRFTYPSSDNKSGAANADTFTGGPYRELYVLMRVFFERSGWETFGNRFFYIGAAKNQRHHNASPTQFYVDRNGSALRVVVQNGVKEIALASYRPPPIGASVNPIAPGRWLTLEFHFVAESAPGARNGRARMWVNAQPAGSNNAVRWNTSGFDGMQWFAEAHRVPVTSYYRLGELYIAGKK